MNWLRLCRRFTVTSGESQTRIVLVNRDTIRYVTALADGSEGQKRCQIVFDRAPAEGYGSMSSMDIDISFDDLAVLLNYSTP